jgi:DNA-binding transcriptional regulator of glucitol operon
VQRFFGSRALAIVAVSLIAVVGGALLAWWQWTRYESASGTLQNLGYVLQWPLFGVFPGFMFWRIHKSAQRERELDEAAEQTEPAAEAAASPGQATVDPRLTYVQNRTMDYGAEADPELLAYNRYLAQLADREQHHAG